MENYIKLKKISNKIKIIDQFYLLRDYGAKGLRIESDNVALKVFKDQVDSG